MQGSFHFDMLRTGYTYQPGSLGKTSLACLELPALALWRHQTMAADATREVDCRRFVVMDFEPHTSLLDEARPL